MAHICTITAQNHLAHARIVARSFRDHHPDGRVTILIIDIDEATPAIDDCPFEIVRPSQLALSRREFHHLAAIYDVDELCTALKPWLLRFLLNRDCGPILYIDPDVEIFGPLDDIISLTDANGIVLTPR